MQNLIFYTPEIKKKNEELFFAPNLHKMLSGRAGSVVTKGTFLH